MKSIFVSSTFKDFQQERDILHDQVLPLLNEQARKYGESVSFCDLRWGVDTSNAVDEDESSEKVLSVCLNEIDRSRPYMIVLVGERYGYTPGEKAISQQTQKRNLTLDETDISVTALEIEYGALLDSKSIANTWFFFREMEETEDLPEYYKAESELHAKRLRELKEKIAKVAADHVITYTPSYSEGKLVGFDSFIEAVTDRLRTQLQAEWNRMEGLSFYEKDGLSQWNYIEEKARSFSVFGEYAENLMEKMRQGASHILLRGSVGSGKSTMFAYVCAQMRKQGWTVIPFVGGNTSVSTDPWQIMKSFVWQLEQLLGESHFEDETEEEGQEEKQKDIKEWRNRLDVLCAKAAGKYKILYAVDALDQLAPGELRDQCQMFPTIRNKNICCFASCIDDFRVTGMDEKIDMPVLTEENGLFVIDGILKNMGKELSMPVKKELFQKKGGKKPLYLYLAILRLTLMNSADFMEIRARGDGMEAITAYHCELVKALPDSLPELGFILVCSVAEHVDLDITMASAKYMALSRHGFRIQDLETLTGLEGAHFNALIFSQFVNYMSELFILRNDGRYDFLHKCLREGLLEKIEDAEEKHTVISDYFLGLPEEDEIRTAEVAWHIIKSGDFDKLYQYIIACDESLARKALGKDLYSDYAENEGQTIAWLAEKLSEDTGEFEKVQDQVNACVALQYGLLDMFSESSEDYERRGRLYELIIDVYERGLQLDGSRKSIIKYCLYACNSLFYLLKSENASEEFTGKAQLYYDKAVAVGEQREELLQDKEFCETIRNILRHIQLSYSACLYRSGTVEGVKTSIAFCRELEKQLLAEAEKEGKQLSTYLMVNCLYQMANSYMKLDEVAYFAESIDCLERAIRYLKEGYADKQIEEEMYYVYLTGAYNQIADYYQSTGVKANIKRAIEYLKMAKELGARLLGISAEPFHVILYATVISNLAVDYASYDWDLYEEEAVRDFEITKGMLMNLYSEISNPQILKALAMLELNMANIATQQDRYELAEERALEGERLIKMALVTNPSLEMKELYWKIRRALGVAYSYQDPLKKLQQSSEIFENILEETEEYADVMREFRLGLYLSLAGNCQVEEATYEKGLEIARKGYEIAESQMQQQASAHIMTSLIKQKARTEYFCYWFANKLGGSERENFALKMCHQCISDEIAYLRSSQNWEELNRVVKYCGKLITCIRTLKEGDGAMGISYIEDVLKEIRTLQEMYPDKNFDKSLAEISHKAVLLYIDRKEYEKALEYELYAKAYFDELCGRSGENVSIQDRKMQCFCLARLGNIYLEMPGEENQQKGLNCREEHYELSGQMAEEIGDNEMWLEAMISARLLANVYEQQGIHTDRILPLRKKALELYDDIWNRSNMEANVHMQKYFICGEMANMVFRSAQNHGTEVEAAAEESLKWMQEACDAVEKLCAERGNYSDKSHRLTAYGKLYQFLIDRGAEEKQVQGTLSIEKCKRIVTVGETLLGIARTYAEEYSRNMEDYIYNIWSTLSGFYILLGSMSNEEAEKSNLKLYQRSMELVNGYEELVQEETVETYMDVCTLLGQDAYEKEDWETAALWYEKKAGFMKRLLAQGKNLTEDIAFAYYKLANCYLKNQEFVKALEAADTSIAYIREFVEKEDTDDAIDSLCVMLVRKRNILKKLQDTSKLPEEQEKYGSERSAVCMEVVQHRNTLLGREASLERAEDLSNAFYSAGLAYSGQGTAQGYNNAILCFEKDVEISRSLVQADSTPKRVRDLCVSLEKIAVNCEKLAEFLEDNRSTLQKGLEYVSEAVKLREQYKKELAEEKYRKEYADAEELQKRLEESLKAGK